MGLGPDKVRHVKYVKDNLTNIKSFVDILKKYTNVESDSSYFVKLFKDIDAKKFNNENTKQIYSKIYTDKLILSLLRYSDISEYRTDMCPDEEYLQVSEENKKLY